MRLIDDFKMRKKNKIKKRGNFFIIQTNRIKELDKTLVLSTRKWNTVSDDTKEWWLPFNQHFYPSGRFIIQRTTSRLRIDWRRNGNWENVGESAGRALMFPRERQRKLESIWMTVFDFEEELVSFWWGGGRKIDPIFEWCNELWTFERNRERNLHPKTNSNSRGCFLNPSAPLSPPTTTAPPPPPLPMTVVPPPLLLSSIL